MSLKFYTRVAKGLKLKVEKFWGLIRMFVEVTGGLFAQIPFYREFFENYKGPGTSFQAIIFIRFFDEKFYIAILHKLAKFHYQTVFTSKVIQ